MFRTRCVSAWCEKYVDTLQLDQTQVGLQGIGIALRVDDADLARHFDEMRRRGFSEYKVKPQGVREQYTPIVLIEPFEGINGRALGFDIATNPIARQALEQSMATGETVLTGQLALAQDAGQNRPAIVMYLPLVAQGNKQVVGWVSGPFRIDDVVASLASQVDRDMDITIYDGATPNAASKMYGVGLPDTGHAEVRYLEFGGRPWTLSIHASPHFDERYANSRHWVVALIGAIASFFKELDSIRAALERWEPVRAELINHTKSGDEFWIELDIVPVADATGWYTHWISIERDITDRKRVDLALQDALREKTALLLEVHHRVKNNLQVITSLLRLESFRCLDASTNAVLQDMQGRVRSRVHQVTADQRGHGTTPNRWAVHCT
jgi:PAS domain-containing protein